MASDDLIVDLRDPPSTCDGHVCAACIGLEALPCPFAAVDPVDALCSIVTDARGVAR